MMCARAKAFNPDSLKSVSATVFIDTGSSESYISVKLTQVLCLLEGREEKVQISRFGDGPPVEMTTCHHKVGLCGPDGDTFTVDGLQTEKIIGPVTQISAIDMNIIHQHKLCLPTRRQMPDIMLGIEHFNRLKLTFELELPSGFVLYKSVLGPLICGKGEITSYLALTDSGLCMTAIKQSDREEENLHELVREYFAKESCEIVSKGDVKQEAEDEVAQKLFDETVIYVPNPKTGPSEPPGRYAVTLPWRPDAENLPHNF